ncbi:hypothetical protein GCM10020220_017310 [Nonomuraea rubra]
MGRARIVVICLSTYEVVQAVLGDAGTLAGRVVVNMTTGSPDQARPMRDRVAEQGGGYLDAVIVGYPEQVGRDDFLLLVSGSEPEWETARQPLALLGGISRHVSESPEGANVLEAATVGAFHMTILAAFAEAAPVRQGARDLAEGVHATGGAGGQRAGVPAGGDSPAARRRGLQHRPGDPRHL